MKTKSLGFLLAFPLLACEEEAPLCKAGDEKCEVGGGKCVVGYDGDCFGGQVCYAEEGAPKGTPGVCTGGQFDANGKLIAAVGFVSFIQEGRWISPYSNRQGGDCFLGCPGYPSVIDYSRSGVLGKAPATLLLSVHGPNAETEPLKVSAQGEEYNSCVKLERPPAEVKPNLVAPSEASIAWWECAFPEENWAGLSTTESFELKLWTENTQAFPWTDAFLVDTRPLEIYLKVGLIVLLDGSLPTGITGISVDVHKVGLNGGEVGAPLAKIEYENLIVERDDGETQSTSKPMSCSYESYFSCGVSFRSPFISPFNDFTIRATEVKAKDLAGNEVSYDELTTTWSSRTLLI